ncbi:MAG: hypothetical protein GY953_16790, partial [bacterium]|nr:hypothetical protein [bacterium]
MRTLARMMTAAALGLIAPAVVSAQDNDGCYFVCRPELKIEPTITFENIFSRHREAELAGDEQVAV